MAEIIKIQKQQQLLKRINSFLIDYFKAIVVVVLLLVLSLGYFLILLPRYRQIANEISTTQKEQATEQQKQKLYLDNLAKLNQAYAQLDSVKLQKINDLLPDAPLAEQLMTQLEKTVKDNGAVLTSMTVNPDDKNYSPIQDTKLPPSFDPTTVKLGKVMITLNLMGLDYQGFKNLLAIFEHNLRLMDVTTVGWSPDSGSVTLQITTYYIKK